MARSVSSSPSALFTSALAYDLPANWTLLVRVKNMASSASHQILLGRRGTDGNGWAFGRTSANEFGLWLFNAETITAGSTAFPTDTNWHAYAVTKSSSSSASFYRDTATAIASSGSANCAASSDTTRGIFVGAMNDAGSGVFNSTAELAEIAIFSRVLNSTELGQWMSGDSPSLYSTGLEHYWKLDAASGGETATVGGYNLSQVGTVGSTTHPTMNYGSVTHDATGALSAGSATLSGTASRNGATVTHSATAALSASAATLSGTSSRTGAAVTHDATATLTAGSATLSGTASHTAAGSFVSDIMVNNTGTAQTNVSIVWEWNKGVIGSAKTSTIYGTGTTSGTGTYTATGLPTGSGFFLATTADGSVYYQTGTVA